MRLLLAFLLCCNAFAADWTRHALRLTGESDKVRENALQALRQMPKLEDTLKSALKTDNKYLALDVITALSMQRLLPTLMEFSKSDENGSVYLAINTLLTSKNQKDIVNVYVDRLQNPKNVSMPSQVVLLDTLGRIGITISNKLFEQYVDSNSFEVRSAALYYIRLQTLKFGVESRLPWIERFLTKEPYQVRLQAIYLIQDLPAKWKAKTIDYLEKCVDDANDRVKTACRSAKGKG